MIPAKLAADIVRALEPGAVTIEADADQAKIASGRSQFAVRVLPADEFPASPGAVASDAVTVSSNELADALRQVVRAASGDEARPILTGVLMQATDEGVQLIATDSLPPRRPRTPRRECRSGRAEGADPVTRAWPNCNVFSAAARKFRFASARPRRVSRSDNAKLTTRLIEGEFPNVLNLVPPSYPNKLTVSREALLDAVKRVKLLVRDQTTPVRMSLRSDGVELTVTNPAEGTATEDVEAKYEGTDMTVAFNPQYLTEGIEAILGDELTLETQDALKASTMRGVGNENYLYLLMPVRVP